MPINILMPALSPTMEKGNLAKWLKKEGEKVKPGDVIAEIETDKATMEVEAVDEGTLAKIVVPEGTADVPVNQLIAVLAGEGEDAKAAGAAASAAPAPKAAEAPKAAAPTAAESAPARRRPLPRRPKRRSRPRQLRAGHQRPRPHLLIPARAPARQGSRHRHRAHRRQRPAWPRDRARRRRRQGRQGAEGARRRAGCGRRGAAADRTGAVRRQGARALRGRLLRGRAARQHAPHHRAAAHRVDADHPAFLPDDRLRDRQAARRARGDQRVGAEEQGRQAGLQALGQRLRHQGAGARAAARAGRQCQLDRGRHAEAQAFRRRRRGRDAGRADHADHPRRRRPKSLSVDLQRDEGLRGARARAQAQARTNIRAAPPRSRTSACTASRTSPR